MAHRYKVESTDKNPIVDGHILFWLGIILALTVVWTIVEIFIF